MQGVNNGLAPFPLTGTPSDPVSACQAACQNAAPCASGSVASTCTGQNQASTCCPDGGSYYNTSTNLCACYSSQTITGELSAWDALNPSGIGTGILNADQKKLQTAYAALPAVSLNGVQYPSTAGASTARQQCVAQNIAQKNQQDMTEQIIKGVISVVAVLLFLGVIITIWVMVHRHRKAMMAVVQP